MGCFTFFMHQDDSIMYIGIVLLKKNFIFFSFIINNSFILRINEKSKPGVVIFIHLCQRCRTSRAQKVNSS